MPKKECFRLQYDMETKQSAERPLEMDDSEASNKWYTTMRNDYRILFFINFIRMKTETEWNINGAQHTHTHTRTRAARSFVHMYEVP